MAYTINNPGGGDCGFYAFSIGLIEIIQAEHKLKGTSRTFERWRDKGLVGVSIQDILDFDLYQLYQTPQRYKKEQLFLLQMSLRNITVLANKEDLLNKISAEKSSKDGTSQIEGTVIYGKFMELVQFYLKKADATLHHIRQFNELALSPQVVELAKKTAESLRQKLKETRSFATAQKIENDYVKKVVLQDVLLEDKVNPDSLILKGAERIKAQGRWATHTDLNEVAAQLEVNLHVVSKINGEPIPEHPTVTLHNQSNSHWTTSVKQLPEPKQKVSPPLVEKTPKEHVPASKKLAQETHEKVTERSQKEEHVLATTVSTQVNPDKVAIYKEHIKKIIEASSSQRLFAQVKNKIDVNAIDTTEAAIDEKGVQESDESFATRLQEAELRRVKLR